MSTASPPVVMNENAGVRFVVDGLRRLHTAATQDPARAAQATLQEAVLALGPIVVIAADTVKEGSADGSDGTAWIAAATLPSGHDIQNLHPVSRFQSFVAGTAACLATLGGGVTDNSAAASILFGPKSADAMLLTPFDVEIEGGAFFALAGLDAAGLPTCGTSSRTQEALCNVAPALGLQPQTLRGLQACARATIHALSAAGPLVTVDGAFATLWYVAAPSPSLNDTPPKGEPLRLPARRYTPIMSAIYTRFSIPDSGVPFQTAVSIIVDACIAFYCDLPVDAATSLPLGVVSSLVTHFCQRSVTACRVVIAWILGLLRQPIALKGQEDAAGLARGATAADWERIDRATCLASQLLSQFGFEFPWNLVTNMAATAAATRWPWQHHLMLGLVSLLNASTFEERLKSTVSASMAAVAPPSFTTLASLRRTRSGTDDTWCIFELPPGTEVAVGEFRKLLSSIASIQGDDAVRRGATPSISGTRIKRLLLDNRVASAGAVNQQLRDGGYVLPQARMLTDADEWLAAVIYFCSPPPVRSARCSSARLLFAALPDDANSVQERADKWVVVASTLLRQLTRHETGVSSDNGAMSVGVGYLWDAVWILVQARLIRPRAMTLLLADANVSSLCGTAMVRRRLLDATAWVIGREHEAAALVAAAEASGDSHVADLRLLLRLASLEAAEFLRDAGAVLRDVLRAVTVDDAAATPVGIVQASCVASTVTALARAAPARHDHHHGGSAVATNDAADLGKILDAFASRAGWRDDLAAAFEKLLRSEPPSAATT